MSFKINDAVILKEGIPEEGLKAGAVGVVVAEFSEPNEAYEIEFLDDDGDLLAQLALLPEQLSKFE
ncbi:DUF4926 domain-containing protein [Marinobacter halodurans]|uniref:DUF4926 domain-containing protein n=1 Tax=Marinobacter halodurans TaxID=2528979 RepID=A0ABY1ZF92_9GAMM|nr:DUF4926 domain-containing protein [Marinobacter halodurans]TBW45047.1 DUF4926 domain-containing protein [Marinobacter halodurans]